jgi:hypothetical protein
VRPLATSTTWNPVRPATGMKNKPATHITAILMPNSQGEHSDVISPSPTLLWPFSLSFPTSGLNFPFFLSPIPQPKDLEGYVTAVRTPESSSMW